MTIRTVDLGGTDWADGVGPNYAADFNDTFNAITTHMKVATDSTNRQSTGAYADTGFTFTIVVPTANVGRITGFSMTATVTTSGGSGYGGCRLKVVGAGTNYFVQDASITGATSVLGLTYSPRVMASPTIHQGLLEVNGATTKELSVSFCPNLLLDTTTTTFTLQVMNNGAGTTTVNPTSITVTYVQFAAT